MKAKRIALVVIIILLLTPLWLWLAWLITPKRELNVMILDKTVLTKEGQEHKCLNWILNQQKFVKRDGSFYDIPVDYYGFFPLGNEEFEIHDLEKLDSTDLMKMSKDYDMLYYTDLYGIYVNEWYRHVDVAERSQKVYGGLTNREVDLMSLMKDQGKLVVTEFNFDQAPTDGGVRARAERLWGIHWTGWIGRYFASLDTVDNPDLPKWVYHNYMRQHYGRWPFKHSGVVFDYWDDTIEVLEQDKDLQKGKTVPTIFARKYGIDYYGLPEEMIYPYWLDLTLTSDTNKVVATYQVFTTKRGDSLLALHGIPNTFPAIFEHKGTDYQYHYFAGDFVDNPNSIITSKFKYVSFFKAFFYSRDPDDRRKFFWTFYRPMMTKILEDYYAKLKGRS